jgi:hypothetical protein
MSKAKEVDRLYFEANPNAFSYDRAPLPQEWADGDIPADATVSVYRINGMSRVRALQNSSGERLATPIMDVDGEQYRKKTVFGSRGKNAAA